MAKKRLEGKKVAIVATDGFEESELLEPKKALEAAGATVHVIAPKSGPVRAMKHHAWASTIEADRTTAEALPDEYDALVLPGGVFNPDQLRLDRDAIDFIRDIALAGKPVGAICHGPWTLIDAGAVKGRTVTSYPSLRMDLVNAGAKWVDREVVVDKGLVTSRKPEDLPAFCAKLIEEIAEGKHEERVPEARA